MKTPSYLRLLLIVLLVVSAFGMQEQRQTAKCIVIKDTATVSKPAAIKSNTTDVRMDFWKIDDDY